MAEFPISKICSNCNVEKPISFFGKCAGYRGGYRHQCTPCRGSKNKPPRPMSPEQRLKMNARNRARNIAQGLWRKHRYGVNMTQYNAMFASQNGVCAICGSPPKASYLLCIDHCHETKRVRGLLCKRCNTGLGFLGDNIDGLERAIQYIKG